MDQFTQISQELLNLISEWKIKLLTLSYTITYRPQAAEKTDHFFMRNL